MRLRIWGVEIAVSRPALPVWMKDHQALAVIIPITVIVLALIGYICNWSEFSSTKWYFSYWWLVALFLVIVFLLIRNEKRRQALSGWVKSLGKKGWPSIRFKKAEGDEKKEKGSDGKMWIQWITTLIMLAAIITLHGGTVSKRFFNEMPVQTTLLGVGILVVSRWIKILNPKGFQLCLIAILAYQGYDLWKAGQKSIAGTGWDKTIQATGHTAGQVVAHWSRPRPPTPPPPKPWTIVFYDCKGKQRGVPRLAKVEENGTSITIHYGVDGGVMAGQAVGNNRWAGQAAETGWTNGSFSVEKNPVLGTYNGHWQTPGSVNECERKGGCFQLIKK